VPYKIQNPINFELIGFCYAIYFSECPNITSAEIEELSLRTPRPMAIYLCESEATDTIMPRHN